MSENLIEDPENAKFLVKQMRELVKDNSLQCPLSDFYLLRALRCSDFNVKLAFKQISCLTKSKTKYPELYEGWNPDTFEELFRMNIVDVFVEKALDGAKIAYFRFGNLDISKYTLMVQIAHLLWATLVASELEEVQKNGMHLIADLGDVSFSQIRAFSLRESSIFMHMLQDSVPLKFLKIHFINTGYISGILLKFALSFFSEKTKQMVVIHGNNYESLHKYYPKEILPVEAGGSMGTFTSNENNTLGMVKSTHGRDWSQYF